MNLVKIPNLFVRFGKGATLSEKLAAADVSAFLAAPWPHKKITYWPKAL